MHGVSSGTPPASWARSSIAALKKLWETPYEIRLPPHVGMILVRIRSVASATSSIARRRCEILGEMLPREGEESFDVNRCVRWMEPVRPNCPLPKDLLDTEEQRDRLLQWAGVRAKETPADLVKMLQERLAPYAPSFRGEPPKPLKSAFPKVCRLALIVCAWYISLTHEDGCIPCFTSFTPAVHASRSRRPIGGGGSSAASPARKRVQATAEEEEEEEEEEDDEDTGHDSGSGSGSSKKDDGEIVAKKKGKSPKSKPKPKPNPKATSTMVDPDILARLEPGLTLEQDLVIVPHPPHTIFLSDPGKTTSMFCEQRAKLANTRTRAPIKMASVLEAVDQVTLNGVLLGLKVGENVIGMDVVEDSMEIKRYGDLPMHDPHEHQTIKRVKPTPPTFSKLTCKERLAEMMEIFDDVVGETRDRPGHLPFRDAYITRPEDTVRILPRDLAELRLDLERDLPSSSGGLIFRWESLCAKLTEEEVLDPEETPKAAVRYLLKTCLASGPPSKEWTEDACRRLLAVCVRLRAIVAAQNALYAANALRNMDHLKYGIKTDRLGLGKNRELYLEGAAVLGQSAGIGPLAASIGNACSLIRKLDVNNPATMDVTEETKRKSRERYGDANLLCEDSKNLAIQAAMGAFVAADMCFSKWPTNLGSFPWEICHILEEIGVEQYVSWTQMCALFLEPETDNKATRKFTESDRETWRFTKRIWGHISEENRVQMRSWFLAAVLEDAATEEEKPASARNAEAAAYPMEHPLEGSWGRVVQARRAGLGSLDLHNHRQQEENTPPTSAAKTTRPKKRRQAKRPKIEVKQEDLPGTAMNVAPDEEDEEDEEETENNEGIQERPTSPSFRRSLPSTPPHPVLPGRGKGKGTGATQRKRKRPTMSLSSTLPPTPPPPLLFQSYPSFVPNFSRSDSLSHTPYAPMYMDTSYPSSFLGGQTEPENAWQPTPTLFDLPSYE